MKINVLIARLAVLIIGLSVSNTLLAGDAETAAELELVRNKVSTIFTEISPENIRVSPVDGWYTVRKGAIVAYISGDGRFLLQGDLIDLDQQINLSEAERNDARVDMLAAVPESQTITFSPDEVRYSVSIFTDIDCTYCRRLHGQIDEYLAQGIEIKYLLYPRGGPASNSWVKAENVWCADDRNEALTLAKVDKSFETHSCDTSTVSKHYAIGRDVGLTGTPAIVLPDGTLMPGYLPPAQLLQTLSEAEKVASN